MSRADQRQVKHHPNYSYSDEQGTKKDRFYVKVYIQQGQMVLICCLEHRDESHDDATNADNQSILK